MLGKDSLQLLVCYSSLVLSMKPSKLRLYPLLYSRKGRLGSERLVCSVVLRRRYRSWSCPRLACLTSVCSVTLRLRYHSRSCSRLACLASIWLVALRWSCRSRSCSDLACLASLSAQPFCVGTVSRSFKYLAWIWNQEHAILEENIYGMWPRTRTHTDKHFNANSLVWGSLRLAPMNIIKTVWSDMNLQSGVLPVSCYLNEHSG